MTLKEQQAILYMLSHDKWNATKNIDQYVRNAVEDMVLSKT